MIESEFLFQIMNSDFFVFEVVNGWYLKETEDIVSTHMNTSNPYIRCSADSLWQKDSGNKGRQIQLTSNLLFAQRFEKSEVKQFKDDYHRWFEGGYFKKITMNTKLSN